MENDETSFSEKVTQAKVDHVKSLYISENQENETLGDSATKEAQVSSTIFQNVPRKHTKIIHFYLGPNKHF